MKSIPEVKKDTMPERPFLPALSIDEELTPAERQFQRSLVRIIILVTLAVTPLIGIGYLWAYFFVAPVWTTLGLGLALFGFMPVSFYAFAHYRRGNLTRAVRAIMTWMLIVSGLITVLLLPSLMLIGIMVAIMLSLMALFLEPRRVALRWIVLSGAVYIAAMLLRGFVKAPPIQLGMVEVAFLYMAPLCLFLTIAILGNSTIEFLRGTLRESEIVRTQAVESYRQAQQATMVANEANRLKSEFLSMMSHELRTPLNAIIGFTGIMLGGMGGKLDSDAAHMVNRINSNSLHLLDLINNVLDLAKVEAHQFKPIYESFSPQELVTKQSQQMFSLAKNKDLEFEVEVDPHLPDKVIGDKDIIQRIMINLLSNAFKFTETGSVRIKAGLSEDPNKWLISVSDTGIGIPPHAREYIFDPFRQADSSSSRKYGGTGLGLAIVKEMLQEVNGYIHVDSVLGKGSTFTVELPVSPVGEAEKQAVA